MLKSLTIASLAMLLVSPAALAESHQASPGKALAAIVYDSIDKNPDGFVDMNAFTSFGREIFVSMDFNDDGNITLDEFQDWDFGFNFIAEDIEQKRGYETAQKILFAFWDRNPDGAIARIEYQRAMVTDFIQADINNDTHLTEEEFLVGYIVNRAFRAALTGK